VRPARAGFERADRFVTLDGQQAAALQPSGYAGHQDRWTGVLYRFAQSRPGRIVGDVPVGKDLDLAPASEADLRRHLIGDAVAQQPGLPSGQNLPQVLV
jgi:hypothetical protein